MTTLIAPLLLVPETTHVLHPEDQRWALDAGRARRQYHLDHGTHNPFNEHDRDPIDIEKTACGAEIAFARMVGVRPILERERWWEEPNGYLPNGKPYDVSHTPKRDGKILVPCWVDNPRDWWYVLVVSQWPRYEYRRWIPGDLLIRYDRRWNPRRDYRNPRAWCYAMRQGHMNESLPIW